MWNRRDLKINRTNNPILFYYPDTVLYSSDPFQDNEYYPEKLLEDAAS